MKDKADDAGNVARATCDTTESVELGSACIWTARYDTPTNSAIAIVPRTASVTAAFRPCGWRNALTPLAIASTPVRAVEPKANARRRTNTVNAAVPVDSGCGTVACGHEPTAHRPIPVRTRASIAVTNA